MFQRCFPAKGRKSFKEFHRIESCPKYMHSDENKSFLPKFVALQIMLSMQNSRNFLTVNLKTENLGKIKMFHGLLDHLPTNRKSLPYEKCQIHPAYICIRVNLPQIPRGKIGFLLTTTLPKNLLTIFLFLCLYVNIFMHEMA